MSRRNGGPALSERDGDRDRDRHGDRRVGPPARQAAGDLAQRVTALEAEVANLRAELAALRGGGTAEA